MEKNNKLLAVRNAILTCFGHWELTPDECREVLEMCKKEVDAADKRTSFEVVKKEEE